MLLLKKATGFHITGIDRTDTSTHNGPTCHIDVVQSAAQVELHGAGEGRQDGAASCADA